MSDEGMKEVPFCAVLYTCRGGHDLSIRAHLAFDAISKRILSRNSELVCLSSAGEAALKLAVRCEGHSAPTSFNEAPTLEGGRHSFSQP
jgi:hypothetical protein